MGQHFPGTEKIGALSQSGGVITLAPSRITIGGQQYPTTTLTVTPTGLTSVTLYMVYAVLSGGVVTLVTSTNVNSIGPVGYAAWKLVGAFYSNGGSLGAATIGFGSFVNIDGSPETEMISFTPSVSSGTGTVTNFTVQGFFKRMGDKLRAYGALQFTGTPAAFTGGVSFGLPGAISMDSTKQPAQSAAMDTFPYGWTTLVDTGVRALAGGVVASTPTSVRVVVIDKAGATSATEVPAITNTFPHAWNATDTIKFDYEVPIAIGTLVQLRTSNATA